MRSQEKKLESNNDTLNPAPPRFGMPWYAILGILTLSVLVFMLPGCKVFAVLLCPAALAFGWWLTKRSAANNSRFAFACRFRSGEIRVMDQEKRLLIDKAARSAAIASWNALGVFLNVRRVYKAAARIVARDGAALPEIMPAEFVHDYRLYCRLVADLDPSIEAELKRPMARVPAMP